MADLLCALLQFYEGTNATLYRSVIQRKGVKATKETVKVVRQGKILFNLYEYFVTFRQQSLLCVNLLDHRLWQDHHSNHAEQTA